MKINFNSEEVTQAKIAAIKKVYHDWGFILRRALKEMTPVDRGSLRSAIQFRVEAPRNKRDITGTIRLIVGVLDPNSPVLRYLKFVVEGTRPHFVPVVTKGGKFTGILGWAQRHGLVYYGSSPSGKGKQAWRWESGENKGKIFGGLETFQPGNDMFNVVYNRYYSQIESEIQSILRGE